jgi:S-formylglutathione hydrolase FrmB
MPMRRFTVAVLAFGALLACASSAAAAVSAIRFRSGDGLELKSVQQLDPRLIALTVDTAALPEPAHVRILLPSGYASHPHRRYPVLYLLHGTSGGASDWTVKGDAEQITAPYQVIVVMPDIALNDDGGGWCTDWPDGYEKWETFHIDQLIPWVQANLHTLNSRGERAIAGLSQGGFCSMSYAAQFPDMFGVALAYSGVPDLAYDTDTFVPVEAVINATEVGLDGVAPDSMFGNPVTNYFNYAQHDPAWLAGNLRWTKMYFYFGNGLPGPYDDDYESNPIETLVHEDNVNFKARLDSLGIKPVVYDAYGNGTHSWPYWIRDLKWSIGPLMSDFAHPAPAPSSFTYTSGAAGYSLYGWTVTMHRLANEFSTLTVRTDRSLVLQGSGDATVLTPPVFRAGDLYLVSIATASGNANLRLRAGVDRRLALKVPLGPSDAKQEFSMGGPGLPSPGTTVYTTNITIRRQGKR